MLFYLCFCVRERDRPERREREVSCRPKRSTGGLKGQCSAVEYLRARFLFAHPGGDGGGGGMGTIAQQCMWTHSLLHPIQRVAADCGHIVLVLDCADLPETPWLWRGARGTQAQSGLRWGLKRAARSRPPTSLGRAPARVYANAPSRIQTTTFISIIREWLAGAGAAAAAAAAANLV